MDDCDPTDSRLTPIGKQLDYRVLMPEARLPELVDCLRQLRNESQ